MFVFARATAKKRMIGDQNENAPPIAHKTCFISYSKV